MTVPGQLPSTERPKKTTRPALPSTRDQAAPNATSPALDRTPSPDSSLSSMAVASTAASSSQIDVTASLGTGRYLGKRWAIYAAVVSIFVLLSGIILGAVSILYHYQTSLSARQNEPPDLLVDFAYDPGANPYQLDNPNFLGLPLSRRTAVVIDAPASSSLWLGLVKEALMAGTDFDTQAVSVQLIFANPEQHSVFPDAPTSLVHLSRNDIRQYLNSHLASGQTNPIKAMRSALSTKPAQLLLVTGQTFSAPQINALRKLLKKASAIRFDAVLIGTHSMDVQTLTVNHKGQYVTLSPQQLNAWRYDAY